MELRAKVQDWLLDEQDLCVSVEITADPEDDYPYLLHIKQGGESVETWCRPEDFTKLIRVLSRAKQERKRLLGDKK